MYCCCTVGYLPVRLKERERDVETDLDLFPTLKLRSKQHAQKYSIRKVKCARESETRRMSQVQSEI